MKPLSLGFLGLGIMGQSMARNLLQAGYSVSVWNRNLARAEELRSSGAKIAVTPAEVGMASEVVFTCLTDGSAVADVLFAESGVFSNNPKPRVVVDFSTISPREAREIGKRLQAAGTAFLDAPVTGGDVGAREGTLTIMVGGDGAALAEVREPLEAVGKRIVHVGGSGSGQLTKCVNQISVAIGIAAMTEGLIFAEKADLDMAKTLEIIQSGAAGSWALSNYAPRLLRGDLNPGFSAKHMLKDLRIALEEAETLGLSLPVTELLRGLYAKLCESSRENLGNHALIQYYR